MANESKIDNLGQDIFDVPSDVIEETTKCQYDFGCLTTGECPCGCQVEGVDGKNVIYLKSKKHKQCPYNLPFGDGTLCICPTHYIIQKKQHAFNNLSK